jgi:hypothetical protein
VGDRHLNFHEDRDTLSLRASAGGIFLILAQLRVLAGAAADAGRRRQQA